MKVAELTQIHFDVYSGFLFHSSVRFFVRFFVRFDCPAIHELRLTAMWLNMLFITRYEQ